MRIIVYGAGARAKRFLESSQLENVLFLIDRDKKKSGMIIQQKTVFSPDIIDTVDFSAGDVRILITPQDAYAICLEMANRVDIQYIWILDENMQIQHFEQEKDAWYAWNQLQQLEKNLQLDILQSKSAEIL